MNKTITLDKHEMVVDREDFEDIKGELERLRSVNAELLEACKELIVLIRPEYDYHGNAVDKDLEKAMNKSEKAIAKAEGRA